MLQGVEALEKCVRESAEIDKAWGQGKLHEWSAKRLEAERKAFYGDGSSGADTRTDG